MKWLLAHPYPRRLLTVPAVFLLVFLVVTLLPLWVLAVVFASRWVPLRLRVLRLFWFALVYLLLQAIALAAAILLWVGAGFGTRLDRDRWRRLHYRLLGALLAALMRTARRLFHVRIAVEADPPPERQPDGPRPEARPLIVLSRHAGPGDSFLLAHELLSKYHRRPRIVLKRSMQWDPAIDVLLNRVPTRFISGGGTGTVGTIEDLARDLTARDALVIFPEGSNFTEQRRERAIERLEREGRHDQAMRARVLRHLVAPRPPGTLAAIEAAPRADVVFVAHSGLEPLSTPRGLWRGLPMETEVRARLWVVPSEEIPSGDEARIEWLYGWWERLDAWIDATRTRGSLRD